MPGRLKIKVIAGRHLPVMDRASDLTDAFVEIKFGSTSFKTDVCSKSLNPVWNSEWFKFEVGDEELQDEPLQIRVLDHDTYSSHDAIGKVYIDVDPLLTNDSDHSMSGWFPIYDTMHGIRGEILILIRMELFVDSNEFKQSCCGFRFIYATVIPHCFELENIYGITSELLARGDPEYQWIDKMRSPRASNEARQRLFSKMSGELQRKIGSKAQKMGGNAIVGYQQVLDIEGDSGVVVRGIGTVVSIRPKRYKTLVRRPKMLKQFSTPSPEKLASKMNHRQSSFSSLRSLNRLNSLTSFDYFQGADTSHIKHHHHGSELVEGILISTLRQHPVGMVRRYSNTVCTRAVKLLASPDDAETRVAWWNELRLEMVGHCNSLGCNAILGYTETTSVCDDVILMSAQGTAAVIDKCLQQKSGLEHDFHDCDAITNATEDGSDVFCSSSQPNDDGGASLFQIPFQLSNNINPCMAQTSPMDPNCLVPDIVLATVDVPPNIAISGRNCLIQARFCRSKKKNSGEASAASITEILPFIEYELHRQLCGKLQLRGLNAIFGLRTSISVGENLIIGLATGTGVKMDALPSPDTSSLKKYVPMPHKRSYQQSLSDYSSTCKERLVIEGQNNFEAMSPKLSARSWLSISSKAGTSDTHNVPTKSTVGISLDDMVNDQDDCDDYSALLSDDLPHKKIVLTTLDSWPRYPNYISKVLQTFQMFRRIRYDDETSDSKLNSSLHLCCKEMITSVMHRLHTTHPNVVNISSLRFDLVLLDDDQFQIWLVGSAFSRVLRLAEEPKDLKTRSATWSSKQVNVVMKESRRIRSISDDNRHAGDRSDSNSAPAPSSGSTLSFLRRLQRSNTVVSIPNRNKRMEFEHFKNSFYDETSLDTIELIPTADVPNISRHLGSINLFIIRETTAVKGSDEELPETEPQGAGCNWFVARGISETQALARAHTRAMGGNALISYACTSAVLSQNFAKNEAQLLMFISGDVVCVDFD